MYMFYVVEMVESALSAREFPLKGNASLFDSGDFLLLLIDLRQDIVCTCNTVLKWNKSVKNKDS